MRRLFLWIFGIRFEERGDKQVVRISGLAYKLMGDKGIKETQVNLLRKGVLLKKIGERTYLAEKLL